MGDWKVKKWVLKGICLIGLIGIFFQPVVVARAEQEPTMMELVQQSNYKVEEYNRPKSAILIDGNTGKYLWGENPDMLRNPASVIKLMTLYLTYQAIEQGRFSLDTTIVGTNRYQQLSQIYALSNAPIVAGVEYPLRELIPMLLVPSSNVATLMLAELIEPDPVKYLAFANEKAAEIGMTNTTIYNATGAAIFAFEGLYVPEGMDGSSLSPAADNETTARDLSILVYHLLKTNPAVLEFTNKSKVTTMQGTPYEASFDSYNHSLPGAMYEYQGVDGLKTGSSQTGGFNIAMTGQRGETRLIAIVLGVGDWADQQGEYYRHPFANAIFDYGFNNFEYREVLASGEHEVDGTKVVLDESLFDTVKKDQELTVSLTDDMIGLGQSLTPVSETLPKVSQKVTKVATVKVVAKEVKHTITKVLPTGLFKSKIGWGIAGGVVLAGLVIFSMSISSARKKRRRRKARQNRGRRM